VADADGNGVRVQPLRPYDSQYYPDKIYLYTGPETPLYAHGGAITDVKGILRQVRRFCLAGAGCCGCPWWPWRNLSESPG
jgi:hypothetical protein